MKIQNIIFLGTAEFGVPSFEMLVKEGYNIPAVVTSPPKRKGRGLVRHETPVHKAALKNGIKRILTPGDLYDKLFIDRLRKIGADLFVVIAFKILPAEVFTIPEAGTINIHASLLPKYRGPAPIQRAIEAGENHTGVSLFFIDRGIDTGDVVKQKPIEIEPGEKTTRLYERMSVLGASALKDVLADINNDNIKRYPQDESIASKAPKLKKNEGYINWNNSAELIYNRVRAFNPFPGTWGYINRKKINISDAAVIEREPDGIPGAIMSVSKKFFDVACGKGCLRILRVKPEGKKEMLSSDFLNGFRIEKGMLFK